MLLLVSLTNEGLFIGWEVNARSLYYSSIPNQGVSIDSRHRPSTSALRSKRPAKAVVALIISIV